MNSEERHHPSMFLAVVLSLAVPAHADSNVAVIVVNPITGSVDAGTDATYEASRRYGMSQCKFWPSKQVEKDACRILGECHASGYAAVARGGTTGNYTFAYTCGMSNYNAAQSRALSECAGGCNIKTTFSISGRQTRPQHDEVSSAKPDASSAP